MELMLQLTPSRCLTLTFISLHLAIRKSKFGKLSQIFSFSSLRWHNSCPCPLFTPQWLDATFMRADWGVTKTKT
jgi:hypothetical protein